MEWMSWLSLIIIACYSAYPGKVKKLEGKVKSLERKIRGDSSMSKIITELIGKECTIKTDEGVSFAGNVEVKCVVLDADDEWIKFSYKDKKGNEKTKILRIDSLDSVEI